MWSEEFDKKAQDAARNHSPAYDEKNWDKMQSLLDKHLPVEKKKRRFIFWWLLPVLMGIGTYIYLGFDKKEKNAEPVASGINLKTKTEISSSEKSEINSSTSINQKADTESSTEKTFTGNSVSKNVETIETPESPYTRISKDSPAKPSTQIIADNRLKKPIDQKDQATMPKSEKTAQSISSLANSTEVAVAQQSIISENNLKDSKPDNKTDVSVKDKSASNETITDSKTADNANPKPVAETVAPIKPQKKSASSRDKGFFAGISIGPDVSGFNMESGKWQFQYGLTAGYSFSKHWSVRTGLLATKKIYTAAPSDYHPPYDLIQYYPGIQKIDADCYVLEIPLTAVYNFGASKKHNWFVSSGLSTYLMKEETYEYYYKNSWGQMETRTKKVENENNHFFSIINISGGYKHQLSKRFFIMAEPYIKIPVSGVGYGDVKLNSAGMLFTIGTKF